MSRVVGLPLSVEERGVIQRCLDRVVEEILLLGLRPELVYDFEEFAALRGAVVPPWVYPSFDPRLSELHSDAHWIRVANQFGDTLGMLASRVFRTADFYELMRDETLWFREPPPGAGTRCVVSGENLPRISGVVAHAGALWVHPSWRKRGLSTLIPLFNRAMLLRNFAIDHQTALVFEGMAASGLPRNGYGFPRVEKVIEGFFPPTGKAERVYLCEINRAEILERMRRVLAPAAAVDAAD
jgi:GNAT superfamily N-acetyltransferase